jgi:hypothetical protein
MRESPYDGLEYEELLKKRGLPSYSINQTVDADTPRSEYDPDFFRHFSAGELEASVMVKYAAWIKTHSALMVWLKQAGESWIVFDSVEYRGPFLR